MQDVAFSQAPIQVWHSLHSIIMLVCPCSEIPLKFEPASSPATLPLPTHRWLAGLGAVCGCGSDCEAKTRSTAASTGLFSKVT